MSKGREIRCYEYVNHPYEQVRDALREDARQVFQSATVSAASRARSVAAELHVDIAGIQVGTDIAISLKDIVEHKHEVGTPRTDLHIEWEAAKSPRLFPFMRATLSVYRLTGSETQLELAGFYDPPLGILGDVIDTIVGHRIAEAAVHRFVNDVANYLRTALSKP